MLTSYLIGVSFAILAGGSVAGDDSGLHAEWLFNPVHRPVMIEVLASARPAPSGGADLTDAASPSGPPMLALMDGVGNLHVEPFAVQPGPFDLSELVPEIWRLHRAAYLQLFVDEQPVGSALVVQPLLSRLVPVTEEAVSPSGVHYTKIVDWRDETAPPVEEDEDPEASRKKKRRSDRDVSRPGGPLPGDPDYDPWLSNAGEPERLLSGLRIYPERDVLMRTSAGDVRLAMRPDHAPNTVWSFLRLCEGGFYRGIDFHRIVPMTRDGDPFVIQAGDPTTTGSGGPGYWLPLENSDLPHDFGVISMARDVDPDSAGSQIFICLSRAGTARLDGHYCSFGYAVAGADTIRAIAGVELADVAAGRPTDPPVIVGADLVPSPPRVPGTGRPDRPVSEVAAGEPDVPAKPKPRRIPR